MQGDTYTTVKIPKKMKRSIDLVRAEIVREKELNTRLIKILEADTCPFCNTKLQDVETMKIKYAKLKECPNCGFTKPVIETEATIKTENLFAAFGAGLLVGLGIFLIAELLRRR